MIKTTLKIDGMRCSMCEAHINDVIRKNVADAKKVKSSHAKGETSFITEQEPDKEKIMEAIAETGYTVLSVNTEEYTKKKMRLF